MEKVDVNIQVRKVLLIHRFLMCKLLELFSFNHYFLIFILSNTNPPRNIDLQLPNDDNSSRRSSYGSDSESRLPSGK
jgi:hypothetical protein